MSRGLNSISRRTRSNWDAFYKSRHDEIKNKKPNQDDALKYHHVNSITVEDSYSDDDDDDDDDDVDFKLNVCKQAGKNQKNRGTRKVGRPLVNSTISIDDSSDEVSNSDDDDDDDYKVELCKEAGNNQKNRGTREVERSHVDSINIEDSDEEYDDDDDYKVKVRKEAGKNQKKRGTRKVERHSISFEDSDGDDDDYKGKAGNKEKKKWTTGKVGRPAKKKKTAGSEMDAINMLVDSIWKEKEKEEAEEESVEEECTLPSKFWFGDNQESRLLPKTDRELEIDSLFRDLEMGLWESENPYPLSDEVDECTISEDHDESPAARCRRGEHDLVLDEEIGVVCKYCRSVLLEIKYVLPSFYEEPCERHGTKQDSAMNEVRFGGSTVGNLASSIHSEATTVLDLISERDRKELYPHQLEGLEFMWRNIAGDTQIKNLKKLSPNNGRGCIISHAPGTGKTRLSIVFLHTFLKLYPNSRPIIIAPRGMLLTWQQELHKWKIGINFHNLNETKLSTEETEFANGLMDQIHEKNKDYIRFVKLCSWMKGGSILGIGYRLFEELAGEHYKNDRFKKILLESPGLLVMDEGHTPRNNQSLMWKALMKTTTKRRIILSGTPFQNNFTELYNTLCLVNPKFSQTSKTTEWSYLTNSISKSKNESDGLKKLRSMIEPFVHIHKGDILEKTLPGLRDCMIVLKSTDLQRKLVQRTGEASDKFLEQAHLASLISVHPSLVSDKPEFSDQKRKLKSLEWEPNAGAKTRFIVKLIELACRSHERVLIFSEFIDPLQHIKRLIQRHFGWREGKEVMYLGGDVGINQRQDRMNWFNEKGGEARVMVASQRACAEGINLVGASRVVLLDVAWNPAVERQAICRAYRIGQERMVFVYHLVTMMEVGKYAKQAEKDRISELLFSQNRQSGGGVGIGGNGFGGDEVQRDELLEGMVGDGMFERIIHQPKESDFVNSFGFLD